MNKILRILDANFNRGREGLRVVEDGVRFILDDAALMRKVKRVRHALAREFVRYFPDGAALTARDSEADAGRKYDTAGRAGAGEIIVRNLMRASEALRCIEEYGKSVKPETAAVFHDLRFAVYALEKEIRAALSSAPLDSKAKTNYHCRTIPRKISHGKQKTV